MPRREWNPSADTTIGRDPKAPWGTCTPGNSPHWRQKRIDPQDSHYNWYRK